MKVKGLFLIVLFILLSTTSVYAQGPQPADLLEDDAYIIPNCSRMQLREWLFARRAAMLATADVLEAMGEGQYPLDKGLLVMQEHVFIIFGYTRPACADALMNWTWFIYFTTNESIACAELEYECVEYAQDRIYLFLYTQDLLLIPLAQYAGINMSTDEWLYNMRPPGWTDAWKAELAKENLKPSNEVQS